MRFCWLIFTALLMAAFNQPAAASVEAEIKAGYKDPFGIGEHNECDVPADRFIVSVKTEDAAITMAYCAAYGVTDAKGFTDKEGRNYLLLRYTVGHGLDPSDLYLEVFRIVPGALLDVMRVPLSWRGGECHDMLMGLYFLQYPYEAVLSPEGGLEITARQKPLDPNERDTCDGHKVPRPPEMRDIRLETHSSILDRLESALPHWFDKSVDVTVKPVIVRFPPNVIEPRKFCADPQGHHFVMQASQEGNPIVKDRYLCSHSTKIDVKVITDTKGRSYQLIEYEESPHYVTGPRYADVPQADRVQNYLEIDLIDPSSPEQTTQMATIPLSARGVGCTYGNYDYDATPNPDGGVRVVLRNTANVGGEVGCKAAPAAPEQIIRVGVPA
jgi:hypothetical protein